VYKYGVQDNRSTTYSYEANGEPRYTQPGVNSGRPVTLKPIPSQRGFEPYDRVAEQVYRTLNADGTLPARYLSAAGKDGIVILSGTIPTVGDKARAEQIARSVAGVKQIRNQIVVNSGSTQ
jgi:osmotically-inducible protein OsmY